MVEEVPVSYGFVRDYDAQRQKDGEIFLFSACFPSSIIRRENWQGYDWLYNFFSVASDTFCHAIVKTFIKAAATINLRNCPKSLKSAH